MSINNTPPFPYEPPTLTEIPKEIAVELIPNRKVYEVRYNVNNSKWVRHNAATYCYHTTYGGIIYSITFTLKQQ